VTDGAREHLDAIGFDDEGDRRVGLADELTVQRQRFRLSRPSDLSKARSADGTPRPGGGLLSTRCAALSTLRT
jgi:hypothetical protein